MDRRRAMVVVLVGVALVLGGLSGGFSTSDASTTDGSATNGGDFAPSCPAGVAGSTDPADSNVTAAEPDATDGSTPRIVELYPNPTTYGNVGEYLVLETPPDTRLENWTITDGHTTAELPNETVSGRVTVSLDPDVTAELTDTDDPILELEGHLRLAADGDDLELRNGSTAIDSVSYDRAPTAERWYRNEGEAEAEDATDSRPADGDWHPRGATCLPVSRADVDEATAFVLPDETDLPLETIREADDRLLLAGYTLTSQSIADELVDAADRGVDVAVLLESGPVGGTPEATEPVLETLEDGDVDVRAIGGEGSRYRYHHPKYAVADDQVLVTTENWKPSGIGGDSSRGWGVRLEDDTLAADLAAVFRADHEGWDTVTGSEYRTNASFVDDESRGTPSHTFPSEHEPETVPVDGAEMLLAPDNAEGRLLELLGAANDEILVKQAAIADDVAVLEETLEAARRGVAVEILLDSSWYHEDENEALARGLEATAAEESLSLEVRLLEETDRFEKIHAKGVVIDRETAIVGSANWNENAFENNREVLLALYGEEIAGYYADVFVDDWEGDGGLWALPFGLSVTVVVALALAALVGHRYVRFGNE
ncbi:phospholipase D-like domain-containing protein [Natronorubrum texcoconense]|uniref:Phosphatidylserine/phosphatidylglycerophosphate/cardiolipin synthase n=1 Tax=Natronorubrum texcoconense TaxID=1095776 RepID=A0A1G9AHY6_9EURY|nr:phospholipase D-like domain-containing protein [Natronorubrum texcoconense]SDK26180.1 Phosphatidylserine/phosphatidylglycerophosphate/cardiolipin synthase [Natronorubrum texcoconense]